MRELEQINTNEIIKIEEHNGQRLVNARELHEFLESKQEFSNWIKNRIEKYGFIDNQDYTSFDKIIKRGKGATTRTEYGLTVDMAKELSMVENNERGRVARRYFIEAEKKLRGVAQLTRKQLAQMILEEAEEKERYKKRVRTLADETFDLHDKIADKNEKYSNLDKEKEIVEMENEEYEKLFNSNSGISITHIAKELEMSAQKLNIILNIIGIQYKRGKHWYLYTKHLSKGYTITSYIPAESKKGETKSIRHLYWTQRGREMIHRIIDKLRIDPEMRRKFNISENELEMNSF